MVLSKNAQELYLKDIKQIEEKIQEVYYIRQFEIAKEFERRIGEIKTYLLQASCEEKFDYDAKWHLSKEIVYLEFDINLFFKQKGNYIKEKQKMHTLEENLDKIIDKDINKDTKKLWEDLSDITTKWNQQENSTLTNQEANNIIAKAVLRIYKEQVKRGEEIELYKISEYCLTENFLYAVKDELIQIAQSQEENKQKGTFELARELTEKDLKNPLIWQKLTQLDNITINIVDKKEENVNLQEQGEIKGLKENNINTLLAFKKQDERLSYNLLELIRNKIAYWRKYYLKYDTKYILADVDEKTGTYNNVRIRWGNLEDIDEFNLNKKRKIIQIITNAKEIKYKFRKCENLKEITFLDEVRIMDNRVLAECKKLKKVIMGKGITKIPCDCFASSAIEKIEIHGCLIEIDDGACYGCKNLHSIELKEGLKHIGNSAFSYSGLEEIEIPDSVIDMGDYTFYRCEKLKKATMGKEITKIPWRCFKESGISEVEVHGILEKIEEEAFILCKNLHSIELKEGLKHIGNSAFRYSGLEEIEIPDSVIDMGDYTFYGCEKLKKTTMGKGITEIQKSCSEKKTSLLKNERSRDIECVKGFLARCKYLNDKEDKENEWEIS